MSLLAYDPSKHPSFLPRPKGPAWAGEVALMLKTGWTERQMQEENTLLRLRQIEAFLDAEGRAERTQKVQLPSSPFQDKDASKGNVRP